MGDGSVRWLPAATDPAVFRAMVTRAGKESLPDLDGLAPKLKPGKDERELRGGNGPVGANPPGGPGGG